MDEQEIEALERETGAIHAWLLLPGERRTRDVLVSLDWPTEEDIADDDALVDIMIGGMHLLMEPEKFRRLVAGD